MSDLTLPPTLTALRLQCANGEMTPQQALALQAEALDHDAQWHAVTERLPLAPAGDPARPLAGVGLAHKDIFTIGDRRPRCGASFIPAGQPAASPVAQALEHAGSSTLAMLGLAEFAGGVTGENPNLPLPCNPADPKAAVGGSSSGSAVAVAAGLCYGSLGTDTAGSVRIPAATCGVLGLLPTRELLSRTGCFPLSPNLDTVGLLTRSAMDAAQLLANSLPPDVAQTVLPKLVRTDTAALKTGGARLHESLALPRTLRLSLALDHPDARFTPTAKHAQALTDFAHSWPVAAPVRQIRITQQSELARSASVLLHVDAATTHYDALRANDHSLGDIPRGVALPGAAIPASWYAQCLSQRATLLQAFCDSHLADSDIILTPVLPHGVPDWDEVLTHSPGFKPVSLLGLFSWTAWVNYLGLPAVVFPIARDERGRPICVQAIGRPHTEALLLAFAYEYEVAHHGHCGFVPSPAALSSAPLPSKFHHIALP